MMNKILTFIATLLIGLTMLAPTAANAAGIVPSSVCTGKSASSPICAPETTTNPVNHIIKITADIVAVATGAAAVLVIILSGITFITSAGNAEAIANSRKRIIAAVIGLVIVTMAWTIISFATDRLLK